MLGEIFRKAQNKIQNPATLRRLIVDLIDVETVDVAGSRREGRHLRGAAREERRRTPKGARAVLHAARAHQGHRRCDAADAPGQTICDPAVRHRRLPPGRLRLRRQAPRTSTTTRRSTCERRRCPGWELVDSAARLCVMNLYLHGIGADPCPIDGRRGQPGQRSRRAVPTWC